MKKRSPEGEARRIEAVRAYYRTHKTTPERLAQMSEAAKRGWEKIKRPLEDRLWEKVNIKGPNECWEWKSDFATYYPRITKQPAYRDAYEVHHKKKISKGVYICHTCDNRKCVNPHHLYEGTQRANMHDAIKRKRFKYLPKRQGESVHNAKLTEAQVKEIRENYYRTPYKRRGAFAARFGITRTHARRIALGDGWRHC